MAINEKTKKAMKKFGLAEYEIRSYICLLQHEEMIASDLSKSANAPYSKIYEVLTNLEEKGWIESDHSRPKRFKAKSPFIALESMKNRMEKNQKTNETQILSELQPLYESKESLEKPEIWIVRGENNIIERAIDTMSQSRKEILLALPRVSKSLSEKISPALIYLESRGIKVTILATKDSEKVLKKFYKMAEIRVRDKMFGGGIISDTKEVLLLLGSELDSSEALAICSEHLGLAKFAREYFEWLFKTSTKIETS